MQKSNPDTTGTVEFAIRLPKDVLVAVDSFFPVSQLEKIKDADETKDKKIICRCKTKACRSAIELKQKVLMKNILILQRLHLLVFLFAN